MQRMTKKAAKEKSDKIKAAADAKKKLSKQQAKEKAYKKWRKDKRAAMKKLGVVEVVLRADVSAFVDSGIGKKGSKVKQ